MCLQVSSMFYKVSEFSFVRNWIICNCFIHSLSMDTLPLGIQFWWIGYTNTASDYFQSTGIHAYKSRCIFNLLKNYQTMLCGCYTIIYISCISTVQRSWLHITWFDSSYLRAVSCSQVIELAFTYTMQAPVQYNVAFLGRHLESYCSVSLPGWPCVVTASL